MKREHAIERLRQVIRRKHFSLSTEESYCGWLRRYMLFVRKLRSGLASEQKVEVFLTTLARDDVSASTQNQAFNALIFFYREALGRPLQRVDSLRAKRAAVVRNAPSVQETRALLGGVRDASGYPVRLVVKLIYGCGLRVSEPLNLRIRDVRLDDSRLVIRQGKGRKDRVVAIPCSLAGEIKAQMESARAVWRRDVAAGVPIKLPNQIARKYPHSQFAWPWAWLFPLAAPCADPRTGGIVRWRMLECNVQRAVKRAGRKLGLAILPHELRHAYATHCLNSGQNPRAIQEAMGHRSLETTMGYLHAEALSVRSPLEVLV
ncbi:MAG TPA: integron integrase [Burkholderiales bacterium]|nr:integron integrase [Burkholderiales bacterium]